MVCLAASVPFGVAAGGEIEESADNQHDEGAEGDDRGGGGKDISDQTLNALKVATVRLTVGARRSYLSVVQFDKLSLGRSGGAQVFRRQCR